MEFYKNSVNFLKKFCLSILRDRVGTVPFFGSLATRHPPLATRHSPLATRHSPPATRHSQLFFEGGRFWLPIPTRQNNNPQWFGLILWTIPHVFIIELDVINWIRIMKIKKLQKESFFVLFFAQHFSKKEFFLIKILFLFLSPKSKHAATINSSEIFFLFSFEIFCEK